MFTSEDYQRIPHYGHSRPADAIDVCRQADAARLALFHHAPERTDAEVDTILAATRATVAAENIKLSVVAAYEGLDIELGRG
jgi:ribonuclease BN (tRNA processing enzyme)